MPEQTTQPPLPRRRFLKLLSALGLGSSLPARAWAGDGQKPSALSALSTSDLMRAEQVVGLEFTDDERKLMLKGLDEARVNYARVRAVPVGNDIPPAFRFVPSRAGIQPQASGRGSRWSHPAAIAVPDDLERLAFEPVMQLAELVRTRKVTSEALTRMYLARLQRLDAKLHCVITMTPERALARARQADHEIATGRYRGPLHGIPWGVKDLFAVRGQRTTWGAEPYEQQVLDVDATVVARLDAAGAVLLAKLSVGALAWGDVWFGGRTNNPWKLDQGSSGSSAGSASAAAAGLVGFAIGTETWGSVVSPSTRCGATGLRPTFGRVSRHGAMALSWTMDKVGVIGRSVEDCAAVFDAIRGPDGEDLTVEDHPFEWDPARDPRQLRVGYVPGLFERKAEDDGEREWLEFDRQSLTRLREIGIELRPITLPDPALPINELSFVLSAEAGAAFDELTRSGKDDLLGRQVEDAWPNAFRQSRLIPAVEYIQANRIRTLLMREMDRIMAEVDVFVAPTFAGDHLLLTNLTGHPAVVVPNGFRADGTPTSITFTGRLFGEAELLTLAHAYQQATDHHRRHPEL